MIFRVDDLIDLSHSVKHSPLVSRTIPYVKPSQRSRCLGIAKEITYPAPASDNQGGRARGGMLGMEDEHSGRGVFAVHDFAPLDKADGVAISHDRTLSSTTP
jgi:hypothetical protein